MDIFSWIHSHNLTLSCTDGVADVFSLIDPSIAPSLLYYTYLPIIFSVLLFALAIALSRKANTSDRRHVFWIGILFAVLMGIETFLWIGIPVYLIHFAWAIVPILNVLFIILVSSFAHTFLMGTPITHRLLWILVLLCAPILLLSHSSFNLSAFDIGECESVQSYIWPYMYGIETLVGIIIFTFSLKAFQLHHTEKTRTKYILFGLGLLLFIISKTVGDVIALHSVNFLWPLGMISFLLVLAHIAIRYKEFNTRIFGAQIITALMAILVFAALFVRTIENVRYVLGVTLVIVLVLGIILTRSVRREILQKEQNAALAEELARTNERLKLLDQQKSEFLSIATHQLRGPLAAIRGHLSLLLDGSYGAIPEEAKKVISKVFTSGTLMTETVNDFLDVSRIEQGSMKYEYSDFNVGEMVKDIIEELQPAAEEHKLTLAIDGPVPNAVIHADYGKIRHIFFNLTDNALKYTPHGWVKARAYIKENIVRVEISDSGIGIAPDKIDTLFQKFVRMREATGINISGTGLGLYVAKQMVEAHKGRIWVQSEGLGKGTTFVVELPLATHEKQASENTDES